MEEYLSLLQEYCTGMHMFEGSHSHQAFLPLPSGADVAQALPGTAWCPGQGSLVVWPQCCVFIKIKFKNQKKKQKQKHES